MPYDYLWSEEELSRGNGYIIRELLKQIKKSYSKETEYLNNTNNFETFEIKSQLA